VRSQPTECPRFPCAALFFRATLEHYLPGRTPSRSYLTTDRAKEHERNCWWGDKKPRPGGRARVAGTGPSASVLLSHDTATVNTPCRWQRIGGDPPKGRGPMPTPRLRPRYTRSCANTFTPLGRCFARSCRLMCPHPRAPGGARDVANPSSRSRSPSCPPCPLCSRPERGVYAQCAENAPVLRSTSKREGLRAMGGHTPSRVIVARTLSNPSVLPASRSPSRLPCPLCWRPERATGSPPVGIVL
jgi:hypothetical protein